MATAINSRFLFRMLAIFGTKTPIPWSQSENRLSLGFFQPKPTSRTLRNLLPVVETYLSDSERMESYRRYGFSNQWIGKDPYAQPGDRSMKFIDSDGLIWSNPFKSIRDASFTASARIYFEGLFGCSESESLNDAMAEEIVNSDWLKAKMDSGTSNIKVLDASFSRSKDYQKEYHKGHIPGASYFSISHKAPNNDDFPSNIASTEDFQEYARSLGINNDSHVIVYDNSGDGGFYFGGRAWYLFKLFGLEKVSILDNGMHDWVESGHTITTEVPRPERGNFTAKRREDIYTRIEDMEENLTSKNFRVLDSRPPHLYKGDPQNPRSGHYPGAMSIPFGTHLLNPDTGRFRSAEEFKQMYEKMGVDLKKPIVASCRTGMSACSLMLSLKLAGAENYSMYHGSATEWLRKAKLENIERS